MKFQEDRFDDYISTNPLHQDLEDVSLPKTLAHFGNIILYGPPGVGKYTQALRYIKRFSTHDLKYEKTVHLHNQEYSFKISDVHYEVDMDMLGCNSKTLWNDIFYQISDIISCKYDSKHGIILCRNFHMVSHDLLEIFYSYMQSSNIKFVLLSEAVSFIPLNIVSRCQLIPVRRPSAEVYSECLGVPVTQPTETILNIKELVLGVKPNRKKTLLCDAILQKIKEYNSFKFIDLRDDIYSVFNFDVGIEACVWHVVQGLCPQLTPEQLRTILNKTNTTLLLFSSNYRPIYHLEDWIYFVIKVTHGL